MMFSALDISRNANNVENLAQAASQRGDYSGSIIIETTQRLRDTVDAMSATNLRALSTVKKALDDMNASSERQAIVNTRLAWINIAVAVVVLFVGIVQLIVSVRH